MRKILIIGAGGIGSYLIQYLQKTGLYIIDVYDPDKVEKKNMRNKQKRRRKHLKIFLQNMKKP